MSITKSVAELVLLVSKLQTMADQLSRDRGRVAKRDRELANRIANLETSLRGVQ